VVPSNDIELVTGCPNPHYFSGEYELNVRHLVHWW
jgi:hypothetical protein